MFALIVHLSIVVFAQRWSQPPPNFPNVMPFEDWKKFFQPEGFQSLLEHEDRRRVYEDNVAYITRENSKNSGLILGVNQFSILTHDEFRNTVLMQPLSNNTEHKRENVVQLEVGELKASVDWRSAGAVTPVKNQQQCGSCWSFSATGAVEGCVAIATGKLISLSEQELVSCSTANHGCRGGWPSRAFSWINQNGGIDTERDYPYTAQDAYCNRNKQQRKVSVTHKYVNIRSNSDQQLVTALQRGPVSVLVDAGDRNFQHYRGGVMTQSCGTQLDHAVLAVGYDSQSYIVKNSWGTWWGEQGYIRMGRRVGDNSYGQCGILMQPAQPVACSLVGPNPGPTPGPGPSPTPSADSYANPTAGCKDGEIALSIPNVQGQYCAPECTKTACPSAPAQIKGIASCGYRDQTQSRNYCGIFCNPSYSDECNSSKGMTCKPYGQGSGICTYDNVDAHGSYWLYR